ncbi:MAG: 50S ribosomal protein L24 [Candidatus Taylorbacteria bacterium RIFCSPLOWO2_02_FULL_43_11]|uniref:Large ribosomal subunit protein uL24 n=1 Tax=Candidatus Taylorbacteria bacterium RIFCSPHIGHO2_02_FULL_43_32b TaxID=1802306 RepID=A0A1G2MJV7_9BACT|nr:MAG: 50S ribosomal protein L24 [Candidatus Taylorbacteria bacterium RIFCSPHIGHO2_01_FULL_43_47]OHA23301.1 MAG: 50S ribosomal protein L24 [Candidatus Taylorbacteria bacterium RIFCSPHIGHO2_02_FULL_43_32b]OHA30169.1 MAG: 50S ribosomal protein L24 [Candidatus Taylorbacteria bacterium RIFCSPLOWO2_01_FULL_43_44]OHA36022.1 MAG: 50S ribosomal protein L24 [Candidatus Taylorbacteria bacterium RIFCSPLOWO2_02_FULL_43_11]
MNIKKGDNVIVISGIDKGKQGKVLSSFPRDSKILVEGINIKKRHQKRRKENQKGQIVEKAVPILASKVMLLDSTGAKTRVGHKEVGGKKVRVSVRSGKEI